MNVTWEDLGWERLAEGVGRVRLPGWDCTAGLVVGAGTALLVEAGSSLAEGARLGAAVRELTGHDVTHLALTHPHFDHVLGAGAFPGAETYAAVGMDALLAHERAELRLDAVKQGLPVAEADEAVAALPVPLHPVSGELTLDLGGGRQVLLANVGPGHTAHDLAVLVPGAPEIVFCGDLVEESGEPQAGPDAVPARWPAALDRLLALGGPDALYVPGHGAVVDAGFVRRQRDALAARFGVS
ncbi:MBL fold metallo-hydrolase [Streptomyces sp. LaPpAH-108]|uniref:MBL fold metallo-hydrolase n=1 Tax=Streptomyces sp. LaPpAH-108 TaxID=1155714 RepID=UPI0003690879|nr:MBL fold metallo-hydrolase [Streptomyces sp. LaPpAH-108]